MHIYLEGNRVKKLDDDFFPTFQQLKWLDIRNNELEEIPITIANHPNLQVLLLEGNKLERLPVELGSISNLRGLQLARNPLHYPPPEIVSQGSSGIINFFKKEWRNRESDSVTNASCLVKSSKKVNAQRKERRELVRVSSTKTERETEDAKRLPGKLQDCIRIKKLEKLSKETEKTPMTIFKDWNPYEEEEEDGRGDQQLLTAEPDTFNKMKSDRRYEQGDIGKTSSQSGASTCGEIDEDEDGDHDDLHLAKSNALRDTWLDNIRRVLEEQDIELQKRRDKDVLKKWRDKTREIQNALTYYKGNVQLDMPYGVDDDLRMPSRRDLLLKNERVNQRDRRSKYTDYDGNDTMTSKINAILDALTQLQKKRSGRAVSPRTEQKTLSAEIKQITQLQQTLSSMKHMNFLKPAPKL